MARANERNIPLMKPKVCILRSDGTNCDEELYYAFEKFGGTPKYVHVNELRDRSQKLKDFQILALPGGFSYGDDIASGKILAIELVSFLKNSLEEFIEKKGLIIGICNGFQTLVRTGLLPYNKIGEMDVVLTQNKSGHFECRWVKVKIEKSKCLFLRQSSQILDIAVNHGEGNFFADKQKIKKIEDDQLVAIRYVDKNGTATEKYPQNPNGSLNAIAGITDSTGRILGLMPHPEKFVDITQHPNWRREKFIKPHGAYFFENLVKFAQQQ